MISTVSPLLSNTYPIQLMRAPDVPAGSYSVVFGIGEVAAFTFTGTEPREFSCMLVVDDGLAVGRFTVPMRPEVGGGANTLTPASQAPVASAAGFVRLNSEQDVRVECAVDGDQGTDFHIYIDPVMVLAPISTAP